MKWGRGRGMSRSRSRRNMRWVDEYNSSKIYGMGRGRGNK